MPDHLHCIWTLPPGDTDYPERWRLIKLLFSRALPKTERINASRESKGERGIWQRRFWEHTIRDERDLNNHIDYIHYNPVKHGHTARPADWPHSTTHLYVTRKVGSWGTRWVVAALRTHPTSIVGWVRGATHRFTLGIRPMPVWLAGDALRA